jgi:signal transduction histidine kinase
MEQKYQMAYESNTDEMFSLAYPQIEHFIESRENYIRALEKTIELLEKENKKQSKAQNDIIKSIDELISFQKMANIISTAHNPEKIINILSDLTKQVIPLNASNIFLLREQNNLEALSNDPNITYLESIAKQQLEEGIIDWVLDEKKTIIIPDLENTLNNISEKNYIIVPIVLLNKNLGFYLIHTDKQHKKITEHDLQLLSILTNQAAIAIENHNINLQLIKTNEELKVSHAKMVQAAKLAAVGELSGGLAHEINNPLQILLGHVQLLQVDKDLPRRIEIIKEQIERISNITKRLVNFSRAVPEEFKSEPLNVVQALEEILSLVEFQLKESNVEIEKDFKFGIPSIVGNKIYLQQVFLNLILNSKDAMQDGGKLHILIDVKEPYIIIKFSDTGIGIPPQNLGKVFSPFFTTKDSKKGMGLGLSNCRWIILKHHGDIQVESEINKGTTFTITLPYIKTFNLR